MPRMHEFQQIDRQIGAAEAVAKPSGMDARDPVEHGDAASLEITGLVVIGRQERGDIGFLRKCERPLGRHVGSVDAELQRILRRSCHDAVCGQDSQCTESDPCCDR